MISADLPEDEQLVRVFFQSVVQFDLSFRLVQVRDVFWLVRAVAVNVLVLESTRLKDSRDVGV